MSVRRTQRKLLRPIVGHAAALTALVLCSPTHAVVVVFDGFGDADVENNGTALEESDVELGGDAETDTWVPGRLDDGTGSGPTINEVTTVLDAGDVGLRWLQMRGFTGGSTGSNPSAGTGSPKPTLRIVDDTQGVMQETMETGLNVPAIDTGYALSFNSRGRGSSTAAFFDETIILGSEEGDTLKVSFDFRVWRDSPDANTLPAPDDAELRFGLFEDTDNQLGMANPFAGRQEDLDGDGFVEDTPAVWGQEGGAFEGFLSGLRGPGDDIGATGDNGWWASVILENPQGNFPPVIEDGGLSRLREELNDGRLLQGDDVDPVAEPEDVNPDEFIEEFDFVNLDVHKVYNVSLTLQRATIETPGDTIEGTVTVVDEATGETFSFGGVESLEDSTDGGIPIPGTGGVQTDSWDYFAIRNTGFDDFDFLLDNFTIELTGSNVGLDGDFNGNGIVDAADYTVWRDGLGGEFTQDDYNLWKQNFGNALPAGSGALSAAAVPEPAAALLLIAGMLGCGLVPARWGHVR